MSGLDTLKDVRAESRMYPLFRFERPRGAA
jgi:hypothetical protein